MLCTQLCNHVQRIERERASSPGIREGVQPQVGAELVPRMVTRYLSQANVLDFPPLWDKPGEQLALLLPGWGGNKGSPASDALIAVMKRSDSAPWPPKERPRCFQ